MILNWHNTNMYTRYPFSEDTPLVDITNVVTLPNDFLLDFFATYYTSSPASVVLRSLDFDPGGNFVIVTFLINGVTPAPIPVSAAMVSPHEGSFLITSGGVGVTRVNPVFGPGVLTLLQNPIYYGNLYTFNAELEPSTVAAPYKHSLTKIIAKNIDAEDNEIILPDVGNGAITLIEGFNVSITKGADNQLTINAELNAGAGQPCEPVYDTIDCSCGIYFINGRSPDWSGTFIFEGGNRVVVEQYPANNKLIIRTTVREDNPTCTDPL